MASEPTTIGMRIDAVINAVIASLESLPHSNPEMLYASVIGASLLFSFLVLNSGGSSMALPDGGDADSLNKPKISKAKPLPLASDEPQPKWHILRLTNYIVTFGFLLSVLKFASNATTYLDDSTSLLQFVIIWSISMCYFFGFFGISFIEFDELENNDPQNHQHQMLGKPMPAKGR